MKVAWGRALAVLAAPGVLVRQATTVAFCRVFSVPVLEVSWVRWDWPAPPVRHAHPERLTPAAGVVLGPFSVSVVLCLSLCLPGAVPLLGLGILDPIGCALLWPGLAIGACAFPPAASVQAAWQLVRQEAPLRPVLARILFPAIAWLWGVHQLRRLRMDLWGVALAGLLLPLLILQWAAA